jgi:hypothetical protein
VHDGEVFADFEGGVEVVGVDFVWLDSVRVRVGFEVDVGEELEEDVDS